ncbi:unnamed protein product [marine sediment metagenome]|uniref:Uncharacterized protein n=1 Tax=marine sediment metagenome TaxID=412755 RepID=X1G6R9_9ZZZZ
MNGHVKKSEVKNRLNHLKYKLTAFCDDGDLTVAFSMGQGYCGITFFDTWITERALSDLEGMVLRKVKKTNWLSLGDLINIACSVVFRKYPHLKERELNSRENKAA